MGHNNLTTWISSFNKQCQHFAFPQKSKILEWKGTTKCLPLFLEDMTNLCLDLCSISCLCALSSHSGFLVFMKVGLKNKIAQLQDKRWFSSTCEAEKQWKNSPRMLKTWFRPMAQGAGWIVVLFQTAASLYIVVDRRDSCGKLVNFQDDFTHHQFCLQKKKLCLGWKPLQQAHNLLAWRKILEIIRQDDLKYLW